MFKRFFNRGGGQGQGSEEGQPGDSFSSIEGVKEVEDFTIDPLKNASTVINSVLISPHQALAQGNVTAASQSVTLGASFLEAICEAAGYLKEEDKEEYFKKANEESFKEIKRQNLDKNNSSDGVEIGFIFNISRFKHLLKLVYKRRPVTVDLEV